MPDIALRLGRDVLVVEGSPGAMLARYGFSDDDAPEPLNVLEPETISEIHALHHTAGANCAVSNTFGANAFKLGAIGLADKVADINRAGVECARSVKPEHVLAGVGPCGIDPAESPTACESAQELYREQIEALVDAQPEALLLRRFDSLADLLCVLAVARTACELPVIACCTVGEDGLMLRSHTPIDEAARKLEAAGAAVIGLAHGLSPTEMLPVARQMIAAATLPVFAFPDIRPERRIARTGNLQDASADLLAEAALEMQRAGIAGIGACGEATPVHTGALFAAVAGRPVAERQ